MFSYTCLPHGNVARISLYRALRMLSMVVIFFSWNESKQKQSSFLATIPHLKPPPINKQWLTSTMSQGYGVYSCRFVCTGRMIFASEYTWWAQIGEKWLCPEVWPTADGQHILHPAFSLRSRAEQENEPLQMLADHLQWPVLSEAQEPKSKTKQPPTTTTKTQKQANKKNLERK